MGRRDRRDPVADPVALAALSAACSRPEVLPRLPAAPLPQLGVAAQDATPKQDRRLVPAEAYVRTYLQLFGGLAPLEVQRKARGADGGTLFDTWDDYLEVCRQLNVAPTRHF